MSVSAARIRGLAARLLPSLLIFLGGTGALFLADILIGRFLAEEQIAQWALFKSLLFPLAAISAIGMDQLVVREPNKWRILRWRVFALIGMLALMGAGIVYGVGLFPSFALLAAATAGLAICNLHFGLNRALLHFNRAQISRDGWKLLLLVGVVASITLIEANVVLLAALALLIGALVGITLYARAPKTDVRILFDDVHGMRSALGVSTPFAMTSIALAVASYGEVAILELLGQGEDIAAYFITLLCFVSTMIIFNTYISTFLGSMVRQQPERMVKIYARYRWHFLAMLPLLAALSLGVGTAVQSLIFPDWTIRYDWAVVMAMTAAIRIAYTLVSIVVAALGEKQDIAFLAKWFMALAIALPLLAWLLSMQLAAALAVALAVAIHWLARLVVSLIASRRVIRDGLVRYATD